VAPLGISSTLITPDPNPDNPPPIVELVDGKYDDDDDADDIAIDGGSGAVVGSLFGFNSIISLLEMPSEDIRAEGVEDILT
jgi:hypothetical protein